MAGAAGRTWTLFGRDAELSTLRSALERAADGHGGIVLVSGQAGMGKSALLSEFAGLAEKSGSRVIRGNAFVNIAVPLSAFSGAMWRDLAGEWAERRSSAYFSEVLVMDGGGALISKPAGGSDSARTADVLSVLHNFATDALDRSQRNGAALGRAEIGGSSYLVEREGNFVVAAVLKGAEHPSMGSRLRDEVRGLAEAAGNTGFDGDVSAAVGRLMADRFRVKPDLEGMNLENERLSLADSIVGELSDIARGKPAVLELDDFHMADELSVFVLAHLARNVTKTRMLVVCSYDPDCPRHISDAIDEMRGDGWAEIRLGGLGAAAVESIVDATCRPNNFGHPFFENLAEQSGGNPLFVSEIVRSMLEDGSIAVSNGMHSLSRSDCPIPSSLREAFLRRFESLGPGAMAVAEYAACIGLNVPMELAEASPADDLKGALRELVDRGVLREDRKELSFPNEVLRGAIYTAISPAWRAANHRSIGERLESLHGDAACYELAHHYSKSKAHAKTVKHSLAAAAKAESSFAMEQAVAYYKMALEALTHHEARQVADGLDVSERMGDACVLIGNYDQALDAYGAATAQGDAAARLRRKRAAAMEKKGDYGKALEEVGLGERMADPGGLESPRLAVQRAWTNLRMGEYAKGLAACEAALPMLQGADRDAGNAYNVMGGCHLYLGDYERALDCYGRSLAARERVGDLVNVAASLNNIGVVLGKKGDLKRALEHHERSMRIKEKIGDRLGLSFSYNNIGNLHWNRGEMELAAEYMAKGLENSGMIGDRWGVASSHNNLGNVEYDRGRFAEALEHYRKSLEIRERIGDKEGVSWSHNNMGNVLTCQGDLAAAMRHHETALAISQEIGDREGIAWSHNNIGAVSLESGDFEKALSMHSAGISIAREMGVTDGVLDGLLGTAETLLEMGHAVEAEGPSTEALSLATEGEMKHPRLRALRVSARVSEKLGDWNAAAESFRRSIAEASDAGTVTERAYTLYEYGRCLSERGSDSGKPMLEEARAFFESRGMTRWAERCANALENAANSAGKAAG